MPLSQRRHGPYTSCDISAGVEYSPAQLRDFAADTIVEDKGAEAAAEEAELGHALSRQLRYPRPDVLSYHEDKLRKDHRVGLRKDGGCRLVCDNVIARPKKSPYREAHLMNRSAERADEDHCSGSRRRDAEFLSLEQPVFHANVTRARSRAQSLWIPVSHTYTRRSPQRCPVKTSSSIMPARERVSVQHGRRGAAAVPPRWPRKRTSPTAPRLRRSH